jgi:hypothetical protein
MKTTISRLTDQSAVEIVGELDSQEVGVYRSPALKRLGAELRLDGFRPGHIPEEIIAKTIGEDKLLLEMAELALADYYPKIIVEHKHHPDKKGGDTEKFKEINEAYSVLSDDKKRSQYDQFGSGFNQSGQGGWSGQGFDGFEGFDFSGFSGGGQNGSFEFDLGDLFGDVFGGGRGRGNKNRGRDISIDLELTFSESVFGVDRSILLNKVSTCDFCGRSGDTSWSKECLCG